VEFNSFGPAVGRLGSDSSRGAQVEAGGAEPPPHFNHWSRAVLGIRSVQLGLSHVEVLKLSTTHTHTRLTARFSGTTRVNRYQKGKTNLDFTEASKSEWQWQQLGHMQVCTSLQTDNHASTPPLSFFTGLMPFLPPNQQRQSTEDSSYEPEYANLLSEIKSNTARRKSHR